MKELSEDAGKAKVARKEVRKAVNNVSKKEKCSQLKEVLNRYSPFSNVWNKMRMVKYEFVSIIFLWRYLN